MAGEAEDAARAALRERLGAGARYDAPSAPARDLALARRGTAYFARKLNELDDADLCGASLVPGWTRAHVVAQVGYHARALARLIEGAAAGIEAPMYPSAEARDAEIALGATLPPRALRNLFRHAEVHLNVEWRDLGDAAWDAEVRLLGGARVPARDTARLRAREVWIRAVDLDNGGSFLDFPAELVDRLIAEIPAAWGGRVALTLEPSDRPEPRPIGGGGPAIAGRAADLARWLSGRGARRLTSSTGALPDLPVVTAG